MSKFNVAILSGDTALGSMSIQAGETLEYDIDWRNADGSARDMGGSTVAVKVYLMPERKLQYSTTLGDPTKLLVASNITTGWPTRRSYHCEIWETTGAGKVGAGHVALSVGD